MNDYTFHIHFPDGEILCHTITAASRFTAEMFLADQYPEATHVEFVNIT